jgi:small-conductance mechanosensitive channel
MTTRNAASAFLPLPAVAQVSPQDAEVDERLISVWDRVIDLANDLIALAPLLVVAIVIVLLFWWLAYLVGHWDAPFRRLSAHRFAQDLAQQVAKAAVFLLGVLLALEVLQATALVGAVLGAAGLLGLAIGFAFKDLVENYIASILLSVRQPFSPGDHVVIEGHEGKVVRLTPRATILVTLNGNHLRIPNATVFKGLLLNYTTNPKRRFELKVGVGVEEGLSRVRETALEVLRAMDGVIDDPPPTVLIDQLGDSTVSIVCRGWIDQRSADFGKVRSEAIRLIKERFEADGITMPEPTYRVQMVAAPAAAPREPPGAPEPPRITDTGDISVERHLDEQIAAERAGEEDLLEESAPQE